MLADSLVLFEALTLSLKLFKLSDKLPYVLKLSRKDSLLSVDNFALVLKLSASSLLRFLIDSLAFSELD